MDSEHPYNWAVEGPPFGQWATTLGTFNAVMREQIVLNRDGTGLLVCSSALRGKEIVNLAWRHTGPGQLEIVELDAGGPSEVAPDDIWQSVQYRVGWASSDASGKQPVLRNLDSESFWTLSGPLQLTSRAER